MFVVRRSQLQAFEAASRAAFEDEMTRRCAALAPERSRALGEEALHAMIRDAIDEAAAHGFTQRGPVGLYVELTLLLGRGFPGDPRYPWAAQALAREDLVDELVRAEALHHQSCAHLERAGEAS